MVVHIEQAQNCSFGEGKERIRFFSAIIQAKENNAKPLKAKIEKKEAQVTSII